MEIPALFILPIFLLGFLVGLWAAQRGDAWRNTIVWPRSSPELDAQVRVLISGGKKLAAIKLYREFHHVAFKEAKDTIDAIERAPRVTT